MFPREKVGVEKMRLGKGCGSRKTFYMEKVGLGRRWVGERMWARDKTFPREKMCP
jgi:hypothetical protein